MSLNSPTLNVSPSESPDPSVRLSHGQAIIRFVLAYAFFHILFSSLDLWSTWIGKDMPHFAENNPYTDLTSIYTMAMPEVIHLFVGSLIVGLCVYARRQRIVEITEYSYPKFLWSLPTFHLEFLAINLVIMAFARFIIVINNLSCMVQFYCPITDEYDIGNFNLMFGLIVFSTHMLSWLPVSYLMYRVLRIGRRT